MKIKFSTLFRSIVWAFLLYKTYYETGVYTFCLGLMIAVTIESLMIIALNVIDLIKASLESNTEVLKTFDWLRFKVKDKRG